MAQTSGAWPRDRTEGSPLSLVVVALDVDRRATAARDPEAPAHWATFERAFWEYVEHQRRA
jgi:hypothetical protein